jgi:hypothetical protein
LTLTLHIRALDARGRVADVARVPVGSLTLGSARHNALVLADEAIPHVQARVDWDGVSSHVTLTNLGLDVVQVGDLRVQPQASLVWEVGQWVRIGTFTLKLATMHTPDSSTAHNTSAQKQAGQSRVRWPGVLALVMGLLAAAALVYAFLSRPAQILSFAMRSEGDQRRITFDVQYATRIALLVNDQPADPTHLRFDAATGQGVYEPGAQDAAFELIAYNALNQPTRSTLAMALLPTPTPAPTPNPTATPLPGDPFVAEFTFNGLNKANELSDLILNKGDGLVIAWNVANVGGVELQPAGTFNAQDSIRVAPQETTVYTLIAKNNVGQASRSVKVIVVDAQATLVAVTTANANTKATQDAIAASNAQAGATATASARGTATAIALILADAQARATQAAFEGTATAAAQATSLALGTAQASATQQVVDAAGATATAIVQATAGADMTRFAQFNGEWVNQTPAATGLVRLSIANAGSSITVRAFDACTPQPCDWGPRTQTFTDGPFVVRYDFGDGSSRTLLIERVSEMLRVQDVDSRGPVRLYVFVRA